MMDRYIELAQQSDDHTDLLLELLGTMVYMPTDLWGEKIEKWNMIEFLHNHLMNGYAEDDIVLECVMLVGTICRNDEIAQTIASSYLIKLLQDLLGSKQEDDEMVQQILNTFFKFLFFAPTRDIVLHQTQMVSIVLELLSDKNPNIRVLVNAILDYVQIHDDNWKQEIKAKRFQVHNSIYCQMMEEYEKQYPIADQNDPMYDMYYYDQQQNGYGYEDGLEDEEGFESDEGMNGLYVEGLADRMWAEDDD